MKLITNIIPFIIFAFILGACENENNYSQLIEQEQELIDDYLAREGYEVLSSFPADSVFESNQIYRFPNEGIYIQIVDKGVGDTLRLGDHFIMRYRQSTLDEYPMVEDYWTTSDRPYPYIMTFGDLTNSCEGWQTAFEVMKRSDSHAKVIVPSKLGRDIQEVVPYFYEIKLKVLPK